MDNTNNMFNTDNMDIIPENECPVCFEKMSSNVYIINCGSGHAFCDNCEFNWRMKMEPTNEGRVLICPMCRQAEPVSGQRSKESLKKELALVYTRMVPKKVMHEVQRLGIYNRESL